MKAHILDLRRYRYLASVAVFLRLPLQDGMEPVEPQPPRLERDLAARAEPLFLDERDDCRAGISRRREEHREETLRNEIAHTDLVRREHLDGVLGVGRDDRVEVADHCVRDYASQPQHVDREELPC